MLNKGEDYSRDSHLAACRRVEQIVCIAADKFFDHRVLVDRQVFEKGAPVLDRAERVVGRVKRVDLANRAAAGGRAPREGHDLNNMNVMLPWLNRLVQDYRALLGDDWWPYGIAANRAAIEAMLRYHHEQGITLCKFGIEKLFEPELFDT